MGKTVGTRNCGPAQIQVPELAFGSWHTWDRAVFEEVVDMLRASIDAGVTLFDVGVYRAKKVGDPYDHPTDLLFSLAMEQAGIKRDEYQLAIKAWPSKPEPLTEQVKNLLWRQRTDNAEILVLGDIMTDYDSYEPIAEEMADLVNAGVINHWAVNNWSAQQVRDTFAAAKKVGAPVPQFAQLKYGIARRSVAEGQPYGDLMSEFGFSIQASDVFEGGLIFGTNTSRIIAGDLGQITDSLRDSIDRLKDVAAQFNTTVAGLAVAYPLLNPNLANVLVGVRTPKQLAESLGAFDLLKTANHDDLRNALEEFWFDRDVVNAASSWSYTPDDNPEKYLNTVR